LLLSVIALVAAVGGTAIAAPFGLSTDAKSDGNTAKKVATQVFNSKIAAASVAHANTANTATTAGTANTAATAQHAGSADTATSAGTANSATTAGTANSATTAGTANSAASAQHAVSADTATNSQQLGGVAAASYLTAGGTLQPGATEAGEWGVGSNQTAAQIYYTVATFPVALANGVDGNHTIAVNGSSATHCPGAGQADSGYLCVYVSDALNIHTVNNGNIFNSEAGGAPAGSGRFGFSIALIATATGSSFGGGSYAVTG
jgi:hypothetical protein